MRKFFWSILILISSVLLFSYFKNSGHSFIESNKEKLSGSIPLFDSSMKEIADIPLPKGFTRVLAAKGSMGEWLRKLPLRKDKNIYLYNKQLSNHQNWQYAVLNISVPNDGLQQCADALMRLRAEYLYSQNKFDAIRFPYNKTWLSFTANNTCLTHECLMHYLKNVFASCGTYTVEEMTKKVADFNAIEQGNVLVIGGSPGHSMMVADVAENAVTKQKIFLLVQSYMPAEDLHIVKNPEKSKLGPWFEVDSSNEILTPGYEFEKNNLRKW